MTTTIIEVHDDARDCVTVIHVPKPLWLFADLLFQACAIDPRGELPSENNPTVGSCHVYDDKVVLRYHDGDPETAREWCDVLTEEETDEEEDIEWWQ